MHVWHENKRNSDHRHAKPKARNPNVGMKDPSQKWVQCRPILRRFLANPLQGKPPQPKSAPKPPNLVEHQRRTANASSWVGTLSSSRTQLTEAVLSIENPILQRFRWGYHLLCLLRDRNLYTGARRRPLSLWMIWGFVQMLLSRTRSY